MAHATAGGAAFDDLERAVRALGEELAFFRRRALEAERRLREIAAQGGVLQPTAPAASAAQPVADSGGGRRLAALEAENADLRARLVEAAERTRALADRVRFVRQQQHAEDGA